MLKQISTSYQRGNLFLFEAIREVFDGPVEVVADSYVKPFVVLGMIWTLFFGQGAVLAHS